MERKVRAPKGKAPGNTWKARASGKCHRKQTATGNRRQKTEGQKDRKKITSNG